MTTPAPTSAPPPPTAPRTRGWVLGHVAGAPVLLTPSWFLAAAVLTALFAPTVSVFAPHMSGLVVMAVSFAFVLLLLVSVFLHEAAHAIMAKRRGHQVQELAVTLWGGHTHYTGRATRPRDVALVAVVGPLTNLVLAGVFMAFMQVATAGTVPALLLYAGFFSNIFVGVFNLLPGLPLDGGQLLEAAFWAGTGWRSRGTVAAGWTGRIIAIVVAVWAVAWAVVWTREGGHDAADFASLMWAVFVAYFLWTGAGDAINQGKRGEAAGAINARTMLVRAVVVSRTATIPQAAHAAAGIDNAAVVVTDDDGVPLGWVDPEAVAEVPRNLLDTTSVGAVIETFPAGSSVDVTLAGTPLLDHLVATSDGAHIVPVTDKGTVIGVLDVATVAQALRTAGTR